LHLLLSFITSAAIVHCICCYRSLHLLLSFIASAAIVHCICCYRSLHLLLSCIRSLFAARFSHDFSRPLRFAGGGERSTMSFVQVSEDDAGADGSSSSAHAGHVDISMDERKAQMEMAFSTSALSKLSRLRESDATHNEVVVVEATRSGQGKAALGKLAQKAAERLDGGAIALLGHTDEVGRKRQTMRLHEMKARIHQEKLRQQVRAIEARPGCYTCLIINAPFPFSHNICSG
jgi:hypothetical protein